jgi:hypothetical protein
MLEWLYGIQIWHIHRRSRHAHIDLLSLTLSGGRVRRNQQASKVFDKTTVCQDVQGAMQGERRDLSPPRLHNEAAENKPPTL